MPAVWEGFQSLLKLCPENTLERSTPEGVHGVYRWVHGLSYRDDQGRPGRFNEFGRTPGQLFGSLKNLALRLLEALRYVTLSDRAFDSLHAGGIQIKFDTS